MEEEITKKICIGCGRKFTKEEIPPESLRIKKFKYFKRCPECRYRTDIRKNNYWEEYTQNKNLSKTEKFTFIEQIIINIATLIKNDILDYQKELELENKFANNTITEKELIILQNHLEAIVFMLHCKLKPPKYPFGTLEQLDLKLFAYIISSGQKISQSQEEQQ